MYVCGASPNNTSAAMWKIPVSGTGLGTPVAGPTISNALVDCSPVSRVLNGSEYLYVSVTGGGDDGAATTGCSGQSCVYQFKIGDFGLAQEVSTLVLNVNVNAAGSTFTINGTSYTSVAGVSLCTNGQTSNNFTFSNAGGQAGDVTAIENCFGSNPPPGVTITHVAGSSTWVFTGIANANFTDAAASNTDFTATTSVQGSDGVTWSRGTQPKNGLPAGVAGAGTGGFIIDNISGTAGNSQIYFSQLQAGGNAVQAGQTGLQ